MSKRIVAIGLLRLALLVAILDTWSEALPPEFHRYISEKLQPTAFPDIRLRKA